MLATNWPRGADLPTSRKRRKRPRSKVAREKSRAKLLNTQLPKSFEFAQRRAVAAVLTPHSDAIDVEIDRMTAHIGRAAEERRIAEHPTRERTDDATIFVGDGMRYCLDGKRAAVVKAMMRAK